MRKTILYILISFISTCLYAQAPEKINYQAVVRDANGNILPNTSVPITIDVVNGVNTCSVYSGSQTTNSYGLINIELDLSACTIDWSTGTATLSSSINSVSGTSNLTVYPTPFTAALATLLPTTQNLQLMETFLFGALQMDSGKLPQTLEAARLPFLILMETPKLKPKQHPMITLYTLKLTDLREW